MIELLRDRRSIREYLDKPVEDEKIRILEEAALRSPSSKNINPWEFIFVNSPEKIERLTVCKPHGVIPLKTAPLVVAVCADETKSDVWIEDCSIASVLLQLTAQSLGLGSCWIQIRNRMHSENTSSEKYIQEILEIPQHVKVLSLITIGYSAIAREGKPHGELPFGKIRKNSY